MNQAPANNSLPARHRVLLVEDGQDMRDYLALRDGDGLTLIRELKRSTPVVSAW